MDTVVKTPHGAVRGQQSNGVHVFLGVPYAAPPSGANRLRPPQPVEPWDGTRDATRFGPSPPQVAPPEVAGVAWDATASGDECLNVNVWTPDPGGAGLPVMVWIQGGMFELSSTAAYDGTAFARDGVVCVTISWRLGADGFLYLGDDIANLGLLDQVAALEWVRDSIAVFGGDPARVTVFGESAGAMSIGTLLAVPRAEGLFQRAALQSGAAHHVLPVEAALRIGHAFTDKLGVAHRRADVAAQPVERLLAAQAAVKADLLAHPDPARWGLEVVSSVMPWQPVVDGDVVPGPPLERVAAGCAAAVDVVAGTNADDWRLFLAITGAIDQVTEQVLTGRVDVHGYLSLGAYGLPVDTALAAYRASAPDAPPGELLAAAQTDWWVRIPAIRLADAHAPSAAGTYMYEFAWRAPGLGAVHALEVPFVFDTLDPGAPLFGSPAGHRPAAGARGHHARRLGGVRDQRRPGLAALRSRPPRHDALRRALRRGGRPSLMGAGTLGRRPLRRRLCRDRRARAEQSDREHRDRQGAHHSQRSRRCSHTSLTVGKAGTACQRSSSGTRPATATVAECSSSCTPGPVNVAPTTTRRSASTTSWLVPSTPTPCV